MSRQVHPIEIESYAILRSRSDTTHLPPLTRAVVERIVHASADLDYLHDVVTDEEDLARAVAALRAGAPVVTDVRMVASGLATAALAGPVLCRVSDPHAAALARGCGITRSAAGIRLAAEAAGPGAVYVVGCAPTALIEVMAHAREPALVVGLPVGFVGAAESKEALRTSGLPAVSNIGEKGGSAVAAAALNALLHLEDLP